MKPTRQSTSIRAQRGVAAVEFALIAAVFLMLLIGIIEWGRVFFYWNTAAEATRLGARLAVVCDMNDDTIRERMRELFPMLAVGDISVIYEPADCDKSDCELVTVRIAPGRQIETFIPYVPLSLTLPAFATTLPRESMDSGGGNPVCQ